MRLTYDIPDGQIHRAPALYDVVTEKYPPGVHQRQFNSPNIGRGFVVTFKVSTHGQSPHQPCAQNLAERGGKQTAVTPDRYQDVEHWKRLATVTPSRAGKLVSD